LWDVSELYFGSPQFAVSDCLHMVFTIYNRCSRQAYSVNLTPCIENDMVTHRIM
jgi:hypothetical protein